MKKKIVAMCATVALAAVAVGGTLAYFTAKDEVKNAFTVGDIEITLDEAKVDLYGVEQDAPRIHENDYKLIPGHTYVKDPTVTVKAGSEPCYVRMLVTINMQKELDAIFGPNGLPLNTFFGGVSPVWEYVGEVRNEDNTRTYEFLYMGGGNGEVDARNADAELDALFDTFTVPANLTADQLATLVVVDEEKGEIVDQLTIDIVAQAIQSDGLSIGSAFDYYPVG